MASWSEYKQKGRKRVGFRVRYALQIKGHPAARAKYTRTRQSALALATSAKHLEYACRERMARDEEIRRWVMDGLLTAGEAALCFPGWGDTQLRAAPTLKPVDFDAILGAYEERVLGSSKAHDPFRKTHKNHMSVARQVVSWLRSEHPDLVTLEAAACEAYYANLKSQYAQSTAGHHMIKMRHLLEEAAKLGMIQDSPAAGVRVSPPKITKPRYSLLQEEAERLLEMSLNYRQQVHGGLPTIVRLGLYAGLRNEEMRWAQWGWLRENLLSVQHTVLELTGEEWDPKDSEVRSLDVKQALVDYLGEERDRQAREGVLSEFILPGKHKGKPLAESSLQQAFRKMRQDLGMDRKITVYCLRHTYATLFLRSGGDLRTLQYLLGHSSIKTTEGYLHAIRSAEHPTQRLPY